MSMKWILSVALIALLAIKVATMFQPIRDFLGI